MELRNLMEFYGFMNSLTIGPGPTCKAEKIRASWPEPKKMFVVNLYCIGSASFFSIFLPDLILM